MHVILDGTLRPWRFAFTPTHKHKSLAPEIVEAPDVITALRWWLSGFDAAVFEYCGLCTEAPIDCNIITAGKHWFVHFADGSQVQITDLTPDIHAPPPIPEPTVEHTAALAQLEAVEEVENTELDKIEKRLAKLRREAAKLEGKPKRRK